MKKYSRCISRFNTNEVALFISAIFAIIRGLSYAEFIPYDDDELPRGIELINNFFGMDFWICIWVATGIFSLYALLFNKKLESWAWGAISGMLIAWGATYCFGVIENSLQQHLLTRDIVRVFEYLFSGIVIGMLSKINVVYVNKKTNKGE